MSGNPYAPPTAKVDGVPEKTAFDFVAETDYSITPKQLWWAGACCSLSVLLSPIYLYFLLTAPSIPVLKDISQFISIFILGLAIYVYLILKKLLIEKSSYRAANLAISLYIFVSIISGVLGFFSPSAAQGSATFDLLSVGELLLFGAASIYLGLQLLRCEDPLFGQRKPVAYLTLAMGITVATVFLALLGILISIVLDIAMALLFFRASRALSQVQS